MQPGQFTADLSADSRMRSPATTAPSHCARIWPRPRKSRIRRGSIWGYEEAIASFDHAVSLRPAMAEAWYNRGVALAKVGWYSTAVDSYDRALAVSRPGRAAETWSKSEAWRCSKWSDQPTRSVVTIARWEVEGRPSRSRVQSRQCATDAYPVRGCPGVLRPCHRAATGLSRGARRAHPHPLSDMRLAEPGG